MHLAVGAAVLETLEGLKLEFPKVSKTRQKELAAARAALEKGK